MKRSWFPILLVGGLLALLIVLGGLQYVWLGKISEGERARLQKSLESDTQRFAEDFNKEIQAVYFNFQLNAEVWRDKNYAPFNERFDFWRGKTDYSNLVKDFYFTGAENNWAFLRFDKDKRLFSETEADQKLENLRAKLAERKIVSPLDEDLFALVVPIHDREKKLERILIRTDKPRVSPQIEMSKNMDYLIIVLDEAVIENQILPDLSRKYFSEGENAGYRLAVKQNSTSKTIFQTQSEPPETADATAALFDLSADNFLFMLDRSLPPAIIREGGRKTIVETQRFETREITNSSSAKTGDGKILSFQLKEPENPRISVFNRQNSDSKGFWTLSAQHADGSLDKFVANARFRNLAASFGLLSLLGTCILLIFVSAQRAKILAQRQIDFVSSVSHEFRTPLAVIYSAGENLTDGVVYGENQIAQYGNLIKREGKKLSQMVEQILEFAGARSGKRKYDLRPATVRGIIEEALVQCQPLLDEKKFLVESNIAENLPEILADTNALSQAVQNLITNAVKYSNGKNTLKILAANGGGSVKIIVEDNGLGIASTDLKRIFEPFYRAKSVVDAQIHGNGLGLSLVKQTVEAHGGRISAESAKDKGSRFTIHLPIVNDQNT